MQLDINFIFDLILVAASIWMVVEARGLGGIVGSSMNLIVAGAIVLGFAHLIATLGAPIINDTQTNNLLHRVIVLIGFILLVAGFRKMAEIKR